MRTTFTITRNQHAIVSQFFADQDKHNYLLVSDKDSIHSFIAAHTLSRILNTGKEFDSFDIRTACDLIKHLQSQGGYKVAVFDCLITMNEIYKIAQYCDALLVFTTKRTLYSEFLYSGGMKKLPTHVTIVSDFQSTVAELVYDNIHPSDKVVPEYITANDYIGIKPTISTPQHQLLMSLPRDHQYWKMLYPDEFKIGTDAESLGFRLIDNTQRLTRIVNANTSPSIKKQRKYIYLNCHKEDMSGIHYLILKKIEESKRIDCEYHVLYEIKDDWIYYEVIRHKPEIDLTNKFKKVRVHGAPHAVIVRRHNDVVFKGIDL